MLYKLEINISYQISGDEREESNEAFSEEDISFIIEKTGKSEEEVRAALGETNDIAEAIVKLSE